MIKRFLLLLSAAGLLSGGAALAQGTGQAWSVSDEPEARQEVFFVGDNSFLGVFTEAVTKENITQYKLREPRGVAITRVIKDSPAEKAGLKKDDVILSFDGEAVASVAKLNRLIREAAPEKVVRLGISRDGAEQTVSVTLGKRDDFPQVFSYNFDRDEARRFAEEARRQAQEFREMERERLRGEAYGRAYAYGFGGGRRIGVSTIGLTDQLAEYFGIAGKRGVLVQSVTENSPAAKAGIKAGDVITEVDGEKVEESDDLRRAINRKGEGEIKITLIRNKSPLTVSLTPERAEGRRFNYYLSGPEVEFVPPVIRIDPPQVNFRPLVISPTRIRPVVRPARPLRSRVL